VPKLRSGFKALKPFLKKTEVLLLNKDEAAELVLSADGESTTESVESMLKQLHGYGPSVVVITSGRDGSHAYDGSAVYHHDTPQDKPLDTTGAGDCYGSSFVTGYINYDGDIERAMDLAQVNVNSLVSNVGAQQGFLQWKQLPKSLRSV
jgi:ribokinase